MTDSIEGALAIVMQVRGDTQATFRRGHVHAKKFVEQTCALHNCSFLPFNKGVTSAAAP